MIRDRSTHYIGGGGYPCGHVRKNLSLKGEGVRGVPLLNLVWGFPNFTQENILSRLLLKLGFEWREEVDPSCL